jgi:hypothetical protein
MEKLDKNEQRLMDLLPKGMERPRPQKELVKLTGWSSRHVRQTIGRLIVLQHHKPIGARYEHPNNGYFIITNDQERAAAIAPLASQIKELSKRTETLKKLDLKSEE